MKENRKCVPFRQLHSFCFAAVSSILLSGCINTPFTNIKSAEETSIRPPKIQSAYYEMLEMEKLQKVVPDEYLICPADVLSITVEGHEDLSRASVTVIPDGTISVSPIGTVKVSGMTIVDAEKVLNDRYKAVVKDVSVFLEPVQTRPATFTISGTVNAPGKYPLTFGVTRLSDTVSLSKGIVMFKEEANSHVLMGDLDNAFIVRKGKYLPVDFQRALVMHDPLYNIPVMDGDYIFIPSLLSGRITVLGEVGSPQCLVYQPDMTLLKVLGLAGGVRETNSNMIKIIRRVDDNPVVYNVDIGPMLRGKTADFPLSPRDIVYVPKDFISEWNSITTKITPTFNLISAVYGLIPIPGFY